MEPHPASRDSEPPPRRSTTSPEHLKRVGLLAVETFGLAAVFTSLALTGLVLDSVPLIVVGVALQGLWLQRMYCVGHEAAHEKLLMDHPLWNDVLGQLALFFLPVPLPVFKAIHRFHHSANRRDPRTSALDVYVIRGSLRPLRRFLARSAWYVGVFGGGWFVHGLVSILFFLFLPLRVARRVSPAFARWNRRDQLASIGLFALPFALQFWVGSSFGVATWAVLFGLPLLVFAFVHSAQIYIYHYATTLGPETRMHARRVHGGAGVGWWLMNLNQHDTHHRFTRVPWYDLPSVGRPLPEAFSSNQNVDQFHMAVLQQLRGPTLIDEP